MQLDWGSADPSHPHAQPRTCARLLDCSALPGSHKCYGANRGGDERQAGPPGTVHPAPPGSSCTPPSTLRPVAALTSVPDSAGCT